ncbi:MAG: ribosome recycling factor [Gammaproteobacteria bacterium]|nr:ribosome recycling factor [Gammaproteobacteria bacterium]
MIEEILEDANDRMDKSVHALQVTFSKIRSGRANPALLDSVTVDYYGSDTPLKHIAGINVEEGRTLVISPYEKAILGAIEKAIFASDLGVTPANNGDVIRLALPPLTEENRRELKKHAKSEAEQTKVAIRNIRRQAIKDIKEVVKEKMSTEQEGHTGETDAQKLTDNHVHRIDELLAEKETDLMTI